VPLLQKLVIFTRRRIAGPAAAIYFEMMQRRQRCPRAARGSRQLLDMDGDLRRLVQMEVATGMPYNAAVRLERGIEQKLTGDDQKAWSCWDRAGRRARARARDRPAAKAAEMSDDGDSGWLARVHYQREAWDEAIAAIENARSKGKLDKPGQSLLIEAAQYNKKNMTSAHLERARARHRSGDRREVDGARFRVEAKASARKRAGRSRPRSRQAAEADRARDRSRGRSPPSMVQVALHHAVTIARMISEVPSQMRSTRTSR
jgi:hypothetical protein